MGRDVWVVACPGVSSLYPRFVLALLLAGREIRELICGLSLMQIYAMLVSLPQPSKLCGSSSFSSWICSHHVPLGTVDSEDLKLNRAYIVHFVSLFKVLLSILHLNTIIAPFFHF